MGLKYHKLLVCTKNIYMLYYLSTLKFGETSMRARICDLIQRIKSVLTNKKIIVFSDIDKTIRWDKGPLSSRTEQAILKFSACGGLFIPITGGPRNHIPNSILNPLAFAESGALCLFTDRRRRYIIASQNEISAIQSLKKILNINVRDGPCKILGEYPVIIEGIREASLTIICGQHSLYPHLDGQDTCSIFEISEIIAQIIRKNSLPLNFIVGTAETYSWLDITGGFRKDDAIDWFVNTFKFSKVYFMGDGMNDYEAMLLPNVTPVGFRNSIPEIKEIITQREGIMIAQSDGPDGGVVAALERITNQPLR
jgi:hydroxymethylpyrimidine pyrophosphatase-like HAD family hydrolase